MLTQIVIAAISAAVPAYLWFREYRRAEFWRDLCADTDDRLSKSEAAYAKIADTAGRMAMERNAAQRELATLKAKAQPRDPVTGRMLAKVERAA